MSSLHLAATQPPFPQKLAPQENCQPFPYPEILLASVNRHVTPLNVGLQ